MLYDALSHRAILAHCRPSAELRDVGKRGGTYSPTQEWITEQLIELARQGKRVVRLKGGDSFLFARGAEEAEALREAGIPFEVVPGLSSPVGTSAYAGIPLTHRELSSSVTFITGSDKEGRDWSPGAWHKLATATDTLCILMGMRRIREITRALLDGGRAPATPAAVIQWGARPEQRVVTASLESIADVAQQAGLSNPAVIVIGEVVRMRERLRWFDVKPLFSKRVLVPRAEHQAAETAHAIRERGAEAVAFPVIRISDPPNPTLLQRAIAELGQYDWVLFTSANGVDRFFDALRAQGRDARALGGCKVGVIGPKTGEALRRRGVDPDLTAREFVGEDLAKAVIERGGAQRVLLARALVARDELPELLRRAGARVDVVPVYQTTRLEGEAAAELARTLRAGEIDVAIFTSSSTVHNTCDVLGDDAASVLSGLVVASIGPITSRTLEQRGVRVDVSADIYTIQGLLDALEAFFSGVNE